MSRIRTGVMQESQEAFAPLAGNQKKIQTVTSATLVQQKQLPFPPGVANVELPVGAAFAAVGLSGTSKVCEACSKRAAEATNKLRSERIEQQLCPMCGQPRDRDGLYCSICSDGVSRRTLKLVHRRIAAGLCPTCEKPNDTGKYYCDECRKRQNDQRRIRRDQAAMRQIPSKQWRPQWTSTEK